MTSQAEITEIPLEVKCVLLAFEKTGIFFKGLGFLSCFS